MGRITCDPPLRSMLITFLNSFSDIAVNNSFIRASRATPSSVLAISAMILFLQMSECGVEVSPLPRPRMD